MPANILNLPQYRVLRVAQSDHDYHVTAEPVDVTSSCPHCQSDRLTSWGTRQQVFKDLPMHAKRVGIHIDTQRLRCKACGKTFSQALPVLVSVISLFGGAPSPLFEGVPGSRSCTL